MAKTPFKLTVDESSPSNPLTVPAGKNLIVTWSYHAADSWYTAIGALSGAVFGPSSYSKADLMVGVKIPMVAAVSPGIVSDLSKKAVIRGWLVDA